MQLSEENQNTFLVSVHQYIEEQSGGYAKDLLEGNNELPSYPPNGGFTAEEVKALKLLQGNVFLHSAMRKILAGCTAGAIFDLFNLIDGTTDPKYGAWSGVILIDQQQDTERREFLHDEFLATYWDWKKLRPNKDWKLDQLPD